MPTGGASRGKKELRSFLFFGWAYGMAKAMPSRKRKIGLGECFVWGGVYVGPFEAPLTDRGRQSRHEARPHKRKRDSSSSEAP
jgi:hypothetical protein